MAPRTAALAVLLAAALLTGCEGYPAGPDGRVVDRYYGHDPATKATRFELTVRTKDGRRVPFRVAVQVYNACPRGAAYPACTEG